MSRVCFCVDVKRMYRICGSHKARSNITSDFSNLKAINVAAEKTECISASAIVINYPSSKSLRRNQHRSTQNHVFPDVVGPQN